MLALVHCQEDYYKILGVKKGATEDQIKKAFKK
jgi:DnaJ-class molecular chaperone